MSVVVRDLEFKFKEIVGEHDLSSFFIKVADYGKYILDNKLLDSYLGSLKAEARSDVAKYEDACEIFIEKWRELTVDLLEKAKRGGVQDSSQNPFENQIAELTQDIDTKISSEDDYISRRFSNYFELLNRLVGLQGVDNFIPEHMSGEEGDDKHYVLLPYYEQAQVEWRKFQAIRKIRVWWAHYQIMRLTSGILDLDDGGFYFGRNRIIGGFYKYEFDRVARGEVNHLMLLKRDNYLEWIRALHNYIVPRLNEPDKAQDDQSLQKLSKRNLRKVLNGIINTRKFGKKEKGFLKFLSGDFEPHTIEEIGEKVSTKDCKHLKGRVDKKLKVTGFSVKTMKATGWGNKSHYQLEYLPMPGS